MDADRSGGQMTESAADRELQAMLAVEPSPEFVARVRTRIAEEPHAAAWWLSWKLAGAAALAAVVVLAVVMTRWREQPAATPAQAPRVAQDVRTADSGTRPVPPHPSRVQAVQPPLAGESGAPKRGTREGGAPKLAADSGERKQEPEVFIDLRESAALRALIVGARDGRVDLEPVLRAATPSAMDLPPVGAIDIPFLTIDPITPGTGEEGVRQ